MSEITIGHPKLPPPEPRLHLRLTIRPDGADGRFSAVYNDGLEVVDKNGEVVADLSGFLSKATIIREVGHAARWHLEMLGGEIVSEPKPPEPTA